MFSDRFRVARLPITILTLLTFSSCAAYRPIPISDSGEFPQTFKEGDVGRKVSYVTLDGRIHTGNLVSWGVSWFEVERVGSNVRIRLSEVQRLNVSEGLSEPRTVILALTIGLVIGVVVLSAIISPGDFTFGPR